MTEPDSHFAAHFRARWEERGNGTIAALDLAKLLLAEFRRWKTEGYSQVIERVQASLDKPHQVFFRFLVGGEPFYVLIDMEDGREWLLTVYTQPMMQKIKASRRRKKVWRSRAGSQGSNARKRWGR